MFLSFPPAFFFLLCRPSLSRSCWRRREGGAPRHRPDSSPVLDLTQNEVKTYGKHMSSRKSGDFQPDSPTPPDKRRYFRPPIRDCSCLIHSFLQFFRVFFFSLFIFSILFFWNGVKMLFEESGCLQIEWTLQFSSSLYVQCGATGKVFLGKGFREKRPLRRFLGCAERCRLCQILLISSVFWCSDTVLDICFVIFS